MFENQHTVKTGSPKTVTFLSCGEDVKVLASQLTFEMLEDLVESRGHAVASAYVGDMVYKLVAQTKGARNGA